VKYLGHVITAEGISTDLKNTAVVADLRARSRCGVFWDSILITESLSEVFLSRNLCLF